MRVLIVGSGGREHALAWRGVHEGHQVLCAPGSVGIESDGVRCFGGVGASDAAAILALARDEAVDFVLVGPEPPLGEGLAEEAGADVLVPCKGTSQQLDGPLHAQAVVLREQHQRHPTCSEDLLDAVALIVQGVWSCCHFNQNTVSPVGFAEDKPLLVTILSSLLGPNQSSFC